MSMTRISDRRVQRIGGALISAFIELVLTRGYEALTAADISRKASAFGGKHAKSVESNGGLRRRKCHPAAASTPSRSFSSATNGESDVFSPTRSDLVRADILAFSQDVPIPPLSASPLSKTAHRVSLCLQRGIAGSHLPNW
jgi:hypothetical protein